LASSVSDAKEIVTPPDAEAANRLRLLPKLASSSELKRALPNSSVQSTGRQGSGLGFAFVIVEDAGRAFDA
jgi:hypothetical protein